MTSWPLSPFPRSNREWTSASTTTPSSTRLHVAPKQVVGGADVAGPARALAGPDPRPVRARLPAALPRLRLADLALPRPCRRANLPLHRPRLVARFARGTGRRTADGRVPPVPVAGRVRIGGT